MKGRMVPEAPLIRKLRVVGRSRRNAGFCRWKQPVSTSLHRGLAAPGYDFALGIGDELVSYTVKKPRKSANRYFAHSNHLYSVAAITSSTGSVVERWSYNAYGVPTIKNSAGATLAKSGVGQTRGFTGYTLDSETGLYAARARMYSAKSGRFISRNSYLKIFAPTYSVLPWDTFSLVPMRATRVFAGVDYVDGFGLYSGLFAMVQGLDPSGEPGPLALVIGGFSLGEIIGAGLVAGGTVAVVDAGMEWWYSTPTTLEMSKGGEQNKENEFSRYARRTPDPCKTLREMYDDPAQRENRLKIKLAQKFLGCRHRGAIIPPLPPIIPPQPPQQPQPPRDPCSGPGPWSDREDNTSQRERDESAV